MKTSNNTKERKNRLMRKYRLTIHNENKADSAQGFNVSLLWMIVSLFVSFMLVAGVVYLILAFTPVGEYLPGYANNRTREALVGYSLTVDSLRGEVDKQERYISNIRTLLEGKAEYADTLQNDTLPFIGEYPIDTTPLEQDFADEFEKNERYSLTTNASSVGTLQGISFYRPARGMVIRGFNRKDGHLGVDIAESPNESVMAIWDGTVIMSDYTANDGFTIIVQHNEDLISVYRNCYRILKNVGDKVAAGEVIATLSDKSDKESENKLRPYLHLELWHRGEPLDPGIYIAF